MKIIYRLKVISKQKALDLGLDYLRTVYGDQINYLSCRKLWIDSRENIYRVVSV